MSFLFHLRDSFLGWARYSCKLGAASLKILSAYLLLEIDVILCEVTLVICFLGPKIFSSQHQFPEIRPGMMPPGGWENAVNGVLEKSKKTGAKSRLGPNSAEFCWNPDRFGCGSQMHFDGCKLDQFLDSFLIDIFSQLQCFSKTLEDSKIFVSRLRLKHTRRVQSI